MKQLNLLIILVCCLSANIDAQITYTNANFPQAGDVLEVAVSFDSTMSVTAPSATATSWNFSTLTAANYRQDTIFAASTGSAFADFPTADVLGSLVGGLGTTYTDVTTTSMTEIGAGVEFGNVQIISPFIDPFTRRTAPLTYGSTHNDNFDLAFSEHIDSVPFLRALIDSLASGLPVSPDSIRFNLDGSIDQNVDAFGTCQLPDTTYDVIRQKNIVYTNIQVEVYINVPLFGGWQDVTNLLLGALPGNVSPNDTTVYYDYLAEGYKEPIARQNMNNDETEVISTEYRAQEPVLSVQAVNLVPEQAWRIYPNPANQYLQVELNELPQGTYSLELVDVLGKVHYRQQNIVEKQHQLATNQLPQGQYFMVLRNQDQQRVSTKHVQIRH